MKYVHPVFADYERRKAALIKKAGKHECVKESIGTASRVTTSKGKILKRPVVIQRYFWCKICHRNM